MISMVIRLGMLWLILIAVVPVCLGSVANVVTPYRPIGEGLCWDDSAFPIRVNLAEVGSIGKIPALDVAGAARNAMGAWNRALAGQMFIEGSGPNKVITAPVGVDAGYVAQAELQDHDTLITSFTITVNTSVPFSMNFEGDAEAYDLETVLVHEFGHVLGLDHPVSDAARVVGTVVAGSEYAVCYIYPGTTRIMCPQGKGKVMRSPGPDDVTGVKAIYGW